MEKTQLGNIATYINGYAFKPSDWSTKGVPIIRIQNLTGSSSEENRFAGTIPEKFEVNKGDILISWSASLGIYVWNRDKAYLNQHIFKVVFDKCKIDKSFFLHQTKRILDKASNSVHGATMKHLTKPVFDSLPFYLPELKKQQDIGIILNKIQNIIISYQKQLEQLDILIKARFVEMFSNVNEFTELKNVSEVVGGITKNSKRKSLPLKLPYLRVANVYFANIDTTEVLQIGLTELEKNKTLLKDRDLLFVEGNGSIEQIGRLAIWHNQIENCVHQNHLIRVRLNAKLYVPEFVLYYYMSQNGREAIKKQAVSTSGLFTLSVSKIENLLVPIVPIELQNQFASFVQQIDKSKVIVIGFTKSVTMINALGMLAVKDVLKANTKITPA